LACLARASKDADVGRCGGDDVPTGGGFGGDAPRRYRRLAFAAIGGKVRFNVKDEAVRHLLGDLRQVFALYDAVTDAVRLMETGQAKAARERLLPFADLSPSSPMLLLEADLLSRVGEGVSAPEPVSPLPAVKAAATAIITEDGAVLEI
jgi:hypothetical protein